MQKFLTKITVFGLFLAFTAPAAIAGTRYDLRVDGMTCPFCVATSERSLRAIDGISRVSTDLKAGVITVCAAPGVRLTDDRLQALFLSKGFTYRGMRKKGAC